MDSQGPVGIRLRTRPPNGGEVLPHAEDSDDVELCAMKGTPDVEAGPIACPLASSREGEVGHSAEDGASTPRTRLRILAVSKTRTFAAPMARGLHLALLYSAALCILGATTLDGKFHVAPFISASVGLAPELTASLAGAPVVALAVGTIAFVGFVRRRLPSLPVGRDQRIAECLDEMAHVTGALSSVFAMPLGFVMMPHLATETFGAWHALAVTATGLGVLGGCFSAVRS